jgi:hypothetical protein
LDDEFDDWVDGFYGFLHAINPSLLLAYSSNTQGLVTVAHFANIFVPVGNETIMSKDKLVSLFSQTVDILPQLIADEETLEYSSVP